MVPSRLKRRSSRLVAAAAAILLLVAATGGGTRKLAYSLAEPLLVRMADGVLDLRKDQERLLRQRLRGLLAWHKASELPLYTARVEELRARLGDGLSREDARWARGTME